MRAFLAALLAAVFLAGGAGADRAELRELSFEVLLGDRAIGRQRFHVREEGGVRRVTVEADLEVKVWMFSVYTYRHRNEETWEAGCLRRIEATTDDNGTRLYVRGRRSGDGFTVDTGAVSVTLNECVWSFAYWDERFLSRNNLLNAQTGEY
jgi:hypothetical protein